MSKEETTIEHYADRLQREISEIQASYPRLKELMHELKSIDNRPLSDFDYSIERSHLQYLAMKKFLNKSLEEVRDKAIQECIQILGDSETKAIAVRGLEKLKG